MPEAGLMAAGWSSLFIAAILYGYTTIQKWLEFLKKSPGSLHSSLQVLSFSARRGQGRIQDNSSASHRNFICTGSTTDSARCKCSHSHSRWVRQNPVLHIVATRLRSCHHCLWFQPYWLGYWSKETPQNWCWQCWERQWEQEWWMDFVQDRHSAWCRFPQRLHLQRSQRLMGISRAPTLVNSHHHLGTCPGAHRVCCRIHPWGSRSPTTSCAHRCHPTARKWPHAHDPGSLPWPCSRPCL